MRGEKRIAGLLKEAYDTGYRTGHAAGTAQARADLDARDLREREARQLSEDLIARANREEKRRPAKKPLASVPDPADT